MNGKIVEDNLNTSVPDTDIPECCRVTDCDVCDYKSEMASVCYKLYDEVWRDKKLN